MFTRVDGLSSGLLHCSVPFSVFTRCSCFRLRSTVSGVGGKLIHNAAMPTIVCGHVKLCFNLDCLQEVIHIRRILLYLIGSNGRRHGHLMDLPFSLASLHDDRARAEGHVEKCAEQMRTTNACCLRPGTARRLKEKGVDLASDTMRQWSACWSENITMSLSDAERFHARDRYFLKQRGACSSRSGQ